MAELNSDFEELGVVEVPQEQPEGLPEPKTIGIVMEAAAQKAYEWLTEGNMSRPVPGLKVNFPMHPELIYRISNDWKGWNKFLNTPSDLPDFYRHNQLDVIEDHVFELVEFVFNMVNIGKNFSNFGKGS